ncbi:MAG: DUF5803 family protein [Methanothrix sp.]|nr:DUF5803 family protein [Methanothrix sp.]
MYDHLLKAGAWALMVLAVIGAVCSAAQFNGTTYHLGEKYVEVTWPVNASKLNLTLPEKAEDIALLDENGHRVALNSSYLFWQGNHIYSLSFERHVSGDLIYTMPQQGQQFILPLKDSGPVRIILPQGYTTGDRTLGIARPSPDELHADEAGTILIWHNTSGIQYLEVSYYKNNAPQALMMIFGILALAAIALLVEYYISIRRLRSLRKDEEIRG